MRLFIAIELDAQTRSELKNATEILRQNSLHGNFTREENFHLTLAFLGEQESTARIRRAMQTILCKPFTMQIRDTGKFKRTGGDLYWAGVEQNDTLIQLQKKLTQALQAEGFQLESRSFQPHLTLGREVIVKQNTLQKIQQISIESSVKVDAITLMRSDRIGGKLTYTPIYRQLLKS